MKQLKRIEETGVGKTCRKCGIPTVVRKHRFTPTRNFYYRQWDYCYKCKSVYFDEKYKTAEWKENEEQMNFLNSI